jgi:hypothetical protein
VSSPTALRPPYAALSAAANNPATTREQLAAALLAAWGMTGRRRVAEGAVWAAGLQRWQMLTGTDWLAAQQPADAATWADSDHRCRTDEVLPGTWTWRCSCRAASTRDYTSEAAALEAHRVHAAQGGLHG